MRARTAGIYKRCWKVYVDLNTLIEFTQRNAEWCSRFSPALIVYRDHCTSLFGKPKAPSFKPPRELVRVNHCQALPFTLKVAFVKVGTDVHICWLHTLVSPFLRVSTTKPKLIQVRGCNMRIVRDAIMKAMFARKYREGSTIQKLSNHDRLTQIWNRHVPSSLISSIKMSSLSCLSLGVELRSQSSVMPYVYSL